MSKFRNTESDVIVSVADEKDGRFGEGWVLVSDETAEAHEPEVKRTRSRKSNKQ